MVPRLEQAHTAAYCTRRFELVRALESETQKADFLKKNIAEKVFLSKKGTKSRHMCRSWNH